MAVMSQLARNSTALRVQLATFFPELKRPTRHGDLADMDENAEMETWE